MPIQPLNLVSAESLDLGPHAPRYQRWFTLYRYLFGELPRIVPVGGVDPVDGAPLRAFVCTHPLFRDHIALGATHVWERAPRVLGHMHSLGYQAWGCRCFNQIPSVETYMTLHRRFVGAGFGFDLEFSEAAKHRLSFYEWLRYCLRGVFVVHMTTPDFFDDLHLTEPDGPRFETDGRLVPHVIEVVHDLSQHIPNYHYYPKSLLSAFSERIQDAMSDPSFDAALRKKPGPLAGFYDNDINEYAYHVWVRITDPHDFPNMACERRNVEQIFAILDKRIAETAEAARVSTTQRARFRLEDPQPRPAGPGSFHPLEVPPAARGEIAARVAAPFLSEPNHSGGPAAPPALREVRWTDALSVGDPTLDAQHRGWIDILAELRSAFDRDSADAELPAIFERMAAYTRHHFEEEEAFMRSVSYARYDEHKAQHDRFIQRLAALRRRTGELELSEEVLDTILGWLITHIEVVDRQYAPAHSPS